MTVSKYLKNRLLKKGVKGLAKGKTTAIQTLAKEIKALKAANKKEHQYLQYGQAESRINVIQDYLALNLCNYAVGAPIFGADADDDNNYKIVHHSFKMDCFLALENTVNEPDTTTFTMYLVSLRDDVGIGVFNSFTGALVLTPNLHYYNQNGQVLVNPKMFNVHKKIKKVLTNHGQNLANPSAQTQDGTNCRFMVNYSPRQVITNVSGDWKALQSSVDPSKQFYFLIFSDNSAADLQSPGFTYNIVRTMKTIV